MRIRWLAALLLLGLARPSLGGEPPREVRAAAIQDLLAQARARLAAGDATGALSGAARALDEAVALGFEPGADVGSDGLRQDALALGLEAARHLGDAKGIWWFSEAGRDPALLRDLSARERIQATAVSAERREALVALRREAEAQARVAAVARQSSQVEVAARARRVLEAAQDAWIRAEDRLRRDTLEAAGVSQPAPAALEEVRRSLAVGEALVAYRTGPREGMALVVLRDGARAVALPSGRDVPDQVRLLGEALDRRAPVEPHVQSLRAALLDPLALPPSVRTLVVVPDRTLSRIPFCLLVPGLDVAYAPSASVLCVLRASRAPRGEGVLALGDPDYARDRAGPVLVPRLSPLPGTGEEARAVGDVVLVGSDATEAEWRESLAKRPRWRAVHLAGHGLIDLERPILSAIAVGASPGDDGLLTALEVMGMRLPTDLAFLSADRSAQGAGGGGTESVGLLGAFLRAGAPRVVGSLGAVHDEAAAVLVREFYRLWNPRDGSSGVAPAEALRRSQERVASDERWRHPSFWANWALYGLPEA